MIKRDKDVTKFEEDHISIRVLHAWIGGPIPSAHRAELVGRLTELFEISAEHEVDQYLTEAESEDAAELEIDFRARRVSANGGSIDRFIQFASREDVGIEFEFGVTVFGTNRLITFRRDFGLIEWETTEYQVPIVRAEDVREVMRDSVGRTKYQVLDALSRLLPPVLPELKAPAPE